MKTQKYANRSSQLELVELDDVHFDNFGYSRATEVDERHCQNQVIHLNQHDEDIQDDEKRESFEEYRKSYEYYDHRNELRYWDWNHEEREKQDEESESGRRLLVPEEPKPIFAEKYPSLYGWWYTQLWIVSFSALAPGISYWAPNLWWPDPSKPLESINFNLVLLNSIGAAIIAFATEMNAVKYNAIKNGFCSGWTTFANVIEDSGRLILNGLWWEGIMNSWINLICGFIAYRLSQLAVRWYKNRAKEWSDDGTLNTIDRRISIELDKQLRHSEMKAQTSPGSIFSSGRRSMDEVRAHYRRQFIKKRTHNSPYMNWAHRLLFISIWSVYLFSLSFVIWFPDHLPYWIEKRVALYDFLVFTAFTVSAAQFGGWLGSIPAKKSYVHWGTFKVNMCSSIFAGIAHLVLMFRMYVPGSGIHFTVTVYRFLGGFCGTSSSFAGLIDDTVTIFQCTNKGAKRRAFKNVYYNWFLCLVMFLFVVLVVRMAIFFRYFGPLTAKYYLCSSISGIC